MPHHHLERVNIRKRKIKNKKIIKQNEYKSILPANPSFNLSSNLVSFWFLSNDSNNSTIFGQFLFLFWNPSSSSKSLFFISSSCKINYCFPFIIFYFMRKKGSIDWFEHESRPAEMQICMCVQPDFVKYTIVYHKKGTKRKKI